MKLMRSLYKRYVSLTKPRRQVYKRCGRYFMLDQKQFNDIGLIAYKPYETAQLDFFKAKIREYGVTRFIDIGANVGMYSVLIGALPQIEALYAFEPSKTVYHSLIANILVNDLSDKFNGFNCALSAEDGTDILHFHPNFSGTSSLEKEWRTRSNRTEKITKCRLDSLLDPKDFTAPLAIKIDVEGHELETLKGAAEFLSTFPYKLIMQIEIQTSLSESPAVALLKSYGLKHTHTIDETDHYFERH